MQYRTGAQAFAHGVRTLMPLTPGVVPFGLVTGVMAIEMGMSPGMTLGMTLLFYSGSAQMVALQLLHNNVLPVAIVVTALIINLRFIMYSASLAPHLHHLPRRWTWPMSYLLSDQSFALYSLRFSSGEPGRFGHYFYAGTAVAMWLVWQLSVLAGVFLGGQHPRVMVIELCHSPVFPGTAGAQPAQCGEPGRRIGRRVDRRVGHQHALQPGVGHGFDRGRCGRLTD